MIQPSGTIKIEFTIQDGNLRLMLNAPLETLEQRNLTVQILAQAIPIAVNFQPSIIQRPNGSPKIVVPNTTKPN